MNGPMISRSSSWLGIPELNLQDLTLDFGAASVLDGGRVFATQW